MTPVPRLAGLPWPRVAALATRGAVLVVPVGSCEQHGHHLPATTDADVADGVAAALGHGRAAARLADAGVEVVVAPAVPYGSSGEHDGFAGTLSIGQEATRLVLVELVRSARRTFAQVLLLSAHGGNAAPLGAAVRQLVAEGHDVRAWSPRFGGDAHAGRTETSLQLALRPAAVGSDRRAGTTAPLAALLPTLRTGGVRAVSATGVLGDPAGASAAEGQRLLDGAATALAGELVTWVTGAQGAAPRAAAPADAGSPAGTS